MAKYCIFCNDGETYGINFATCPVCDNFLKQMETSGGTSNRRRDEFADYLDDLSGFTEPVVSNLQPAHQYTEQQTSEKRKKEKKEQAKVGRVRNFHEEEVYSPFLLKWWRSFNKGIPYVVGHTLSSFQLYEDENSENGHDVVLYGKMTRGRFADFNRVKVYGKPDHSNSIVAKQIINLNSQSAVGVNYLLPAWAVRVITAVILLVLITTIYTVVTTDWEAMIKNAVNNFMGLLLSLVEPLLLLLIVIGTLWLMISSFFRR